MKSKKLKKAFKIAAVFTALALPAAGLGLSNHVSHNSQPLPAPVVLTEKAAVVTEKPSSPAA